VAGLGAAAICAVTVSWDSKRVAGVLTAVAAATGVGAAAGGILLFRDETSGWLLPAVGSGALPRSTVVVLMIGAAGLCIAGGLRPGRSTVILLAGGLALGLRTGPLLGLRASVTAAAPGVSEGVVGLVLALAALAVLAALLRKPPLAVAIVALAVGAGPLKLVPSSRLLAAGAVLALAIERSPARGRSGRASGWFLAVPGAAAAVVGAIDAGTAPAVACVGAVAAVGAVLVIGEFLVAGRPVDVGRGPFDWGAVPPALAGAWLLLAPGSWTWAGTQEFRYYDLGAARAGAAALITAVLVVAWENRGPKPRSAEQGDRRDGGDDGDQGEDHGDRLSVELLDQ
jgi:hypothetical protein